MSAAEKDSEKKPKKAPIDPKAKEAREAAKIRRAEAKEKEGKELAAEAQGPKAAAKRPNAVPASEQSRPKYGPTIVMVRRAPQPTALCLYCGSGRGAAAIPYHGAACIPKMLAS